MVALDGAFPYSVTSYKRSATRNAMVGGSPKSRHLMWLGMDVILDDSVLTKDFIKACKRQGLRAIDEGDHIHVQTP